MLPLIKYSWLIVILFTLGGLNIFGLFNLQKDILCEAATIYGNDWDDLMVTPEEMRALEKIKRKVSPVLVDEFMKTDFYLLRWLRVTKLDLNEAEQKLLHNLAWREANSMDQILIEDFSDITGLLPASYDNHDKKNRPVVAISLGSWNFRAAAIQGDIRRTHRYYHFLFENVMHEILDAQSSGLNITRAMVLVDLEGLSFLSANGMSILLRMQTTLQEYYPRFWEEIILINAPAGSTMLWMSIQPILSKQSQEIFKVFDTNKAVWMPYLDQRIDREQRYRNFGGIKNFVM